MTIQAIKAQLSILQVLAHYGLVIKNGHVHCPFHDDKTPSMRVYPATNTVHCFSGNCDHGGKSMDVIDFVMYKEGCSKREAILKCKELLGALPIAATPKPTPKPKPAPMTRAAMAKLWTGLKESLRLNKRGKAYLEGRGLSRRGIGYHSGKLKGTKLEAEAVAAGLILGDGRSWGAGCILFPLRNKIGEVVSFYGRSINGPGHYYQSGRSGLYPGYPPAQTRQLIVTESVIDAATLLEVEGLSHYEVLALYGVNTWSKEHTAALQACPALERVLIALDGDEAGRKGSRVLQAKLKELFPIITVQIIELAEGTDINSVWVDRKSEEEIVHLFTTIEEEAPQKGVIRVKGLDTSDPASLNYQGQYGHFSVKGFKRTKQLDSMKVTLVLSVGDYKSRGKVELYDDAAVEKYCARASEKVGIEPKLLEVDLNRLSDALEGYRNQARSDQTQSRQGPVLSAEAQESAISFLQGEELMPRLNKLLGQSGIVGEERTRLLLLLVASSYQSSSPLHGLIQGSSGSGKTLLMRKILSMVPREKRHIWTRVSDKSLYHSGNTLKNTSIGIEDMDGLSEDALYALRELQSGGVLKYRSTGKKLEGGFAPDGVIAYGPISSLMCTTRGTIYEDNLSRCLLVAIDESEEQTDRILAYQAKKARGERRKSVEERAASRVEHLLRVLQTHEVVNPYAGHLSLPKRAHKIRRLNELFQSFISQVTWWHQYQRSKDEQGRLKTTKADIAFAIELLFETIVLKVDELNGGLRQFYEALKVYVLEAGEGDMEHRFTRREIRQALGVSKSQQGRYFIELLELEYLRQIGTGNRGMHYYQVDYWDDNSALREAIQAHLSKQLSAL